MRLLIFAFIILFLNNSLTSQVLKGTIKESNGEPLPYATVYIQELQQGTTSNTKGNYEIRLPEGKYSVIFQSLGFAPDIRDITLGKNIVNLDIVLQTQYYEIPEVRITASGEDPAYSIMRKAIGIAPYYLNQVSRYLAEVYLKGNLVINRIPKLIQKTMKMEARNQNGGGVSSASIKEGDSFLMESVNELEFNAPDKYIQKVISYNSTFPDEGNEISPMDFIQASFYQPVIGNLIISPLSPEAFSHYSFKYLGASPQANYLINKIEVIPKRKSQQLFSGIIYIIEDLWCLHSVDLVNENIAGKVRIQQLYIPVQESVWMPVSYKFEMNISIIGFKADAGYGSSIRYKEVNPNLKLKKPDIIIGDNRRYIPNNSPVDTVSTRTRKQIEKLLSKEELNNRDMVKLSSLMQKESRESRKDSSDNDLEIKEKVTHIIEKDANKKDSSYWAGIRPIPLSETEIRSLRAGDSIKAKLIIKETKSDTASAEKKEKSRFFGILKDITFGETYSDTLGFRFVNGGILKLKNLGFNTVDGFTYGINFRFSKTWKDGKSFSIYPDFKWAFSREQFMWRVNTQFRFDRMDQSQIFLRAGQASKDFNNNGGVNLFLNGLSSLLLKKNYLKLYGSNWVTLGYKTELANGLYAEINSTYDNRRILTNTTDFSVFKQSDVYSENIPGNRYLEDPADASELLYHQQHVDISGILTYTPRQRYRVSNNVKIPMGSDWPTFTLTWKHGINETPLAGEPWKNYDMVRFEATKSSNIGALGEYYFTLRSGAIINKSNASYYDFFHFNSQQIPLLINNYRDAFMLPGYYALSTPEYFTELHARYTSTYILLKLLPGLSNTLMRENLSFSLLYSHYQKCYTEIGYSMSEIFLLGELGVYAGFDNFSFKSIGGKLVLRFN